MNRRKILASLLSLVLILTVSMPRVAVLAVESGTGNSGMEISKTAEAHDDGSYTITLEAYATGSKVITETKTDVPTDIVLVLDQSGSMDDSMTSTTYNAYDDKTNGNYYDNRHNGGNGNLYHKLENGSYVSVSVNVANESWTAENYSGKTNTQYYSNRNALYAKIDGEYVQVDVSFDLTLNGLVYTYKVGNTTIATGTGRENTPSFIASTTDDSIFYTNVSVDYTNATYVYTYKSGDTEETIITDTGESEVCDITFYRKISSGSITRLEALKTAVTTFADNVAKKAAGPDGDVSTTDDNVNHRIAVVGYASSGTQYNKQQYENTEVFVGGTQYKYGTNAQGQYTNAFQSMDTSGGISNVNASIRNLDAYGGTFTDLGMEMANGIFNANPIAEGQTRSRVIIVFTDGMPGTGNFSTSVANATIKQGDTAKTQYGASVYTVGIFDGADATSAGKQDGSDTQKSNWFMQKLSSNNGTVQTPSYYLSAGDSDSLNSIFQQISDQIESGGSSTTLGSSTVIKDIIAPAFTLPDGATAGNITLETYSCTGKTGDNYSWSKNDTAMEASATVNGDTVSVTGFNFAENYVGTETDASGKVTYRGNKLVISFKVIPKDGFLGGNNVYTNTSAGVYENKDAAEPVLVFDRPQVNVPIKDVTVTPKDKNVYLLGDLTAEQLKTGTAKVGNVTLDLEADNYGLESWQNEYVNITVDSGSGLNDLVNDQVYSVSVTVTPEVSKETSSGTQAETTSGSGTAKINVFKPVLTYKDSTVYYGDTAPTDFSSNLDSTSTEWKHGDTVADTNAMGAAPALTIESSIASSDSAKVVDGKVNTKQDIKVDSIVKIENTDVSTYTQFVHENCDENCSWSETTLDGKPAFLLHVKTCTLTVNKTGENVSDEPFVLEVYKDGSKYTEVTIVGTGSITIKELPVGTYTLKEDTNWAWRYTSEITNDGVLTSSDPIGEVSCKNTPSKDKWFNDFSTVVKNVFGKN